MKRLWLALLGVLAAGAAAAQAPQPVPIIPDLDRYQSYNLTTATPTVGVGFPVFGDCTDIQVRLNSVPLTFGGDWTCASGSGRAINSIALPITDIIITFTAPPSSGHLEIIGDWHPRRLIQPTSPGITRYEFNETVSGITASLRELRFWDRFLAAAALPPVTPTISLWQLRMALAAGSRNLVVEQAIPARYADPINVAWLSRSVLAPNDPFLGFVEQTLGLDDTSLTALIVTANGNRLLTGIDPLALRANLQAIGQLASVERAIPASPDAPANIEWESAPLISPSGPVAALILPIVGVGSMPAVFVGSTNVGTISRRQFGAVLSTAGGMQTVRIAISASPTDLTRAAWLAGQSVGATDLLGSLVTSALYSGDASLTALLFAFAATLHFP